MITRYVYRIYVRVDVRLGPDPEGICMDIFDDVCCTIAMAMVPCIHCASGGLRLVHARLWPAGLAPSVQQALVLRLDGVNLG